ncbi:hypothetical protein F975_02800 [Acinetobacter sp. ANC 3789]|uniref:TetR/AcrR family transcriptional regulator n=1 Tax=Acinetobacter sp. ANC 3789 TaxID=1217714 RepID=UPI0002CEF860|nr:TetR/AcrR family transcriptional regulator [Acinetobacter sp. ANC 3789]ENU79549.1 hypothetical protein F975_02800 [Acinetobacter sp. ANC 3789]
MTLSKKAEQTRQHILDTGFELVLHKGFVGVGLQEILKTSGVPKGSFYHYFASKEVFGCELLQHYISNYGQRLSSLWSQPEVSARTQLLSYFQAWIQDPEQSDTGWAESCLIVKLAAEVADLSEDMRQIMHQGVQALLARLSELLQRGVNEGSMQLCSNPAATAQVLYQMWLGAALLSKLSQNKDPMHDALRATEFMLGQASA